MSRVFANKNVLFCGLLPNITINETDLNKYKEARGLYIEDPWERVKSIFSRDDMGNFHPELEYIISMGQAGLFAGGIYGGAMESIKRTKNFVYTNDAKIYASKSELYKALTNENLLAIINGVIKNAPKMGLFCGTYGLITSCLEAYRNNHLITDNSVAGVIVGALFRFSYGLKGMLSGGIVGGVLGSIYGILIWMGNKLTKTNQLEIKYAHFAYLRHREQLKKGIKQTDSDSESLTSLDNIDLNDSETEEKREEK